MLPARSDEIVQHDVFAPNVTDPTLDFLPSHDDVMVAIVLSRASVVPILLDLNEPLLDAGVAPTSAPQLPRHHDEPDGVRLATPHLHPQRRSSCDDSANAVMRPGMSRLTRAYVPAI